MARNTTPEIVGDLNSSASPHSILGFLTITHPNLPDPIRIVSDPRNFVCGGDEYIGCPFEFKTLTENEKASTTELRVQNVDRRIGQAIEKTNTRAKVTLEVRSTRDFDLSVNPRAEIGVSTVIYGFRQFDLIDITVTAIDVSGTVMLRDYSQEPYPGKRATASRCPALFR